MDTSGREVRASKENLSIPELAEELGVKVSYLYERSRHNQIPGMFRIGRFVRINRARFYQQACVN